MLAELVLVVTAVVALVVALVATPASMAIAVRTGVVDRPGPLKPQASAVPYLGGVAVMAALVVGLVVGRPLVAIPLVTAVVLGVADDVRDLSPWIRLAGQVAVGVTIALVLPTQMPEAVEVLLAVGLTVVLVNGVNFLDGLDALVSTVVAVGAGTFAVLHGGDSRDLAVALGFALVGFLFYNRPPARIYLGDGGSYLLGAALSLLLVWTWEPHVRASTRVGALLIVAVPVAELAFAVIRRARGRRTLVLGDRRHSYDLMVAGGMPVLAVDAVFLAVQLALGAIAVAVSASHSSTVAVVVVVAVAVSIFAAGVLGGVLTPEEETGT